MNQEEHLNMARELMRRADQESAADGGNEMIAAEFLWGGCLGSRRLSNSQL